MTSAILVLGSTIFTIGIIEFLVMFVYIFVSLIKLRQRLESQGRLIKMAPIMVVPQPVVYNQPVVVTTNPTNPPGPGFVVPPPTQAATQPPPYSSVVSEK